MNDSSIAVRGEGPKPTGMVDPRFGRPAGFVVVDLASWQTSCVNNGSSQGVGLFPRGEHSVTDGPNASAGGHKG